MSIQISNLQQAELLQNLTAIESSAIVGGYAYSYASTPIATISAPLFPSISFGYSIGSTSGSATANLNSGTPIFSTNPISFSFTTEPVNLSVNFGTSDAAITTSGIGSIVSRIC